MMEEFDLADFVADGQKHLMDDCSLRCHPDVLKKISVHLPGHIGTRKGYRIEVNEPVFHGKIRMALGAGTGEIKIATSGPANLDIRIWRSGTLEIGHGTTVNQARIVCDDADVVVGKDGLWSDEILIQSNDQHGIVDASSGQVLNAGRKRIEIGPHVWLGRRCMIMPNVTIGRGSIVAAGAILTASTSPNTIFAGVPAKEIRSGVTWSRSPDGMTAAEGQYLS